ncbi:MAG TPA: hypothetical protein VH415_15265 [Nitrososphaeraceae archaeon]|jgi:hypothetical protein
MTKPSSSDIQDIVLADGLKELLSACKIDVLSLSIPDLALLLAVDHYVAKLIQDAVKVRSYQTEELVI